MAADHRDQGRDRPHVGIRRAHERRRGDSVPRHGSGAADCRLASVSGRRRGAAVCHRVVDPPTRAAGADQRLWLRRRESRHPPPDHDLNLARRTGGRSIAVVGWGIHLPHVSFDLQLGSDPWVVCPPESADELLGRKGLLNKDAATRLALCAVHRALKRPPRAPRPQGPPDPRVAVVASSNLGNMSTVLRVARTLRIGGLKEISALDTPNASSNIVASTVGIWFRCGGPNLMVCSGATSGLDAVFLGCTLLRSGRADRVVVVGAEPDDPEAHALYACRATAMRDVPFRPGAAAV